MAAEITPELLDKVVVVEMDPALVQHWVDQASTHSAEQVGAIQVTDELFSVNEPACEALAPYLLGEVTDDPTTTVPTQFRLEGLRTILALEQKQAISPQVSRLCLASIGVATPEGQDFLPIESTGEYDTLTRQLSAA